MDPLLASTVYRTDPGMQLVMFADLAYRMQPEDRRVHQDSCDLTGQAVLRGSCLEHCSGFIHIQCAFAHSHWCDGVAVLIWSAEDPRLWRPDATGASLGLGPKRSFWLAAGKLLAQFLGLHHQLSVGVELTMLVGLTAASLVTLWDLFGVALEILRLLPLVYLTAPVIMAVITIL